MSTATAPLVRMPPVKQPKKFAWPYQNQEKMPEESGAVLKLDTGELQLARSYYLLVKSTPQNPTVIGMIQRILVHLGRAAADLEATVEAYYKSRHREVAI